MPIHNNPHTIGIKKTAMLFTTTLYAERSHTPMPKTSYSPVVGCFDELKVAHYLLSNILVSR